MLMSDMRNISTLLNKRDRGTRLNIISLTVWGWIYLNVLKHISYKLPKNEEEALIFRWCCRP